MSERIIDDLELIEIKVQQCACLFRIILKLIERGDEAIFEFVTVDQAGQCVMRCLVAELTEQA